VSHAPSSQDRRSDPLAPEAVTALLADLVRIPSVNPSLAPDEAHGEGAIADFACAWLADHGVRAWPEEAAPARPNVVAEVGASGPRLVLCGHLDTVGTAGMTIPPFEPRIENGRLYGRGATDMKAGVAACMAAAAALAREPFGGRLLLALVADEEYTSIGAADFVRRHRADGCILAESSGGALVLAHKGFVWADITTRGRAAHGSRFDLGVSAIARMGRIIAALDRFDAEVLRARTAPLVGPASMHCALVRGGAGLSTYAPDCTLSIERRMLPGETAEQVVEELHTVIREAGEEAEITIRTVRGPIDTPPDSPLARAVRDAVLAATGRNPDDTGVPHWMDSAIFADAGIPAVNYGPTGHGPHEPVEWVDLASVAVCARIYVDAARRFAAGP
jgi:acetylornithine deacetylase/succinyl-diaminopimelate desuccinylase-like protein